MPSTESVILTNSHNLKLAAILHMPDKQTRDVWVVLNHGMLSTKDSRKHVGLAEKLVAMGFAVLRFDFSGQGESEGPEEVITYSNGLDDQNAAMANLAERGAKRFLLVGSSMGSGISILNAPKTSYDIAGLALMASITETGMIYRAMREDQKKKWEEQGVYIFHERPVSFDIVLDGRTHNVKESLASFKGPVLFVHGTEDELIPSESIPILAASHDGDTEVVLLDGADHRLSEEAHRQEAMRVIADWADAHFPAV